MYDNHATENSDTESLSAVALPSCERSVASSETSSGSTHNQSIIKTKNDQEVIAKAENKAVLRIRLAVFTVLVVCTVGMACAVYFYMSNAEQTEFEDEYLDFANKVFGALGSTLDLSLGTIDGFIVGMVSHARSTNATW